MKKALLGAVLLAAAGGLFVLGRGYLGFNLASESGARVGSSEQTDFPDLSEWTIAEIERDDFEETEIGPDRIVFRNGKKVENLGYQLNYVAHWVEPQKTPVYFFRGRECVDCDAEDALFIYAVGTGNFLKFTYPGKVYADVDLGDVPDEMVQEVEDEISYASRVFFGSGCVTGDRAQILIYERQRVPSEKRVARFEELLTEIEVDPAGGLKKHARKEKFQSLAETLKKVASGACQELPGEE